jgi:hypothetical protein
MRAAREGTQALTEELRGQGGTAAAALRDGSASVPAEPGPAQVAAAGPRAAGLEREYELLIEMIREGSLLHYGGPRVIDDQDPDLALLLGDQLYAMGLARLADLGDLDAISELADLISLLAQAEAEALAAKTGQLVEAIWLAGASAIGWGPSPEHEAAKTLARTGDGRAAQSLLQATERRG